MWKVYVWAAGSGFWCALAVDASVRGRVGWMLGSLVAAVVYGLAARLCLNAAKGQVGRRLSRAGDVVGGIGVDDREFSRAVHQYLDACESLEAAVYRDGCELGADQAIACALGKVADARVEVCRVWRGRHPGVSGPDDRERSLGVS